jgi:hypothetical protein
VLPAAGDDRSACSDCGTRIRREKLEKNELEETLIQCISGLSPKFQRQNTRTAAHTSVINVIINVIVLI